MKRVIKVLLVMALVAMMLVASIPPAMAAKVRGGVLLPTTQPCLTGTQDAPGGRLVLDPPGRAPGCWVLLPPGAADNPSVNVDLAGVVI